MENKPQLKPHRIQAVIFDLDGVLIDTEWVAFQAWCHWTEAHGGSLEEADYPGLTGLTAEETAAYVMERTGLTFDIAEGTAWTWQWVLDSIQKGCQPMPGSLELVRGLAAQRIPLAIASNSYTSYIENILTCIGLLPFFPIRASIDQVALGKPAPDVYQHAARDLGIDPQHCLAIEDSRVGLRAATAAGMRVIVVPGAHDEHNGFHDAWRKYPSLQGVVDDLDGILLS
jgi:HAD superfamily hydrolase (TIGR01509 family)